MSTPRRLSSTHQRQPVDQDRDVVAVGPGCPALTLVDHILVDDLQAVVVDAGLVDQHDVLRRTVVPLQDLDVVLLDADRLFDDAVIGPGDLVSEEPLPLCIGERDPVQEPPAGSAGSRSTGPRS